MWDGKTRNIAIQLVCSNVARQVARFLLPVFPYLYYSVLCNHQTFSIKVIYMFVQRVQQDTKHAFGMAQKA